MTNLIKLLILLAAPAFAQYHEGDRVRVLVNHHWRPARVISEYDNLAVWVKLRKYKSELVTFDKIRRTK